MNWNFLSASLFQLQSTGWEENGKKDNEDLPSFVVLLIFSEFCRLQGKL